MNETDSQTWNFVIIDELGARPICSFGKPLSLSEKLTLVV